MEDAAFVDRSVNAFHGTTEERAEAILETGDWRASENPWDWLGHGVYFFEESYERARLWAEDEWGSEARVLKTRVRLARCMDLLNADWSPVLVRGYEIVRKEASEKSKPVPENRRGRRELDCAVVNAIARHVCHFDTARAAYHEGTPAFPDSLFLDLTHVQIVVRTHSVILDPPERAD